MVIVFQVHSRTTSLAPFEKVVLHKLPILKLDKSNPEYKEKGKLIQSLPCPFFLQTLMIVIQTRV